MGVRLIGIGQSADMNAVGKWYMHRVRTNARSGDLRVTSGVTIGALFASCGLYALAMTLLPAQPDAGRGNTVMVALVAVAFGVVFMPLPWERISDGMRLAVGPLGMGLTGLYNIASGLDPFRYGYFYLMVILWYGMCERRGMTLKTSPFLIVAYLLPLILDGASASDLASIGYALPIYLLVGETLAWRTDRARRLQRRLEQLAHHDPLTGLPNRAVFTAELRRRCAGPEPVAVLFLDLNGFKQINDRLGHAAGDDVLVQVADTLRTAKRRGSRDLACRLAGDEFVVLLPDTQLEVARALAERIERRLGELSATDGTPVGASVGVAGGLSMDPNDLLAAADEAMYLAKQARRPASEAS
ncbi:adrA [Actinoplanes sp. SE50]|nr:Protein adrA [Actinoplanes sp. SE50/110]ATO82933.1 adrA [Actinoplanes sp. SE50]SLM00341.1 diguanylate cyclase [Actinoplanes sp. SE50/110]